MVVTTERKAHKEKEPGVGQVSWDAKRQPIFKLLMDLVGILVEIKALSVSSCSNKVSRTKNKLNSMTCVTLIFNMLN